HPRPRGDTPEEVTSLNYVRSQAILLPELAGEIAALQLCALTRRYPDPVATRRGDPPHQMGIQPRQHFGIEVGEGGEHRKGCRQLHMDAVEGEPVRRLRSEAVAVTSPTDHRHGIEPRHVMLRF